MRPRESWHTFFCFASHFSLVSEWKFTSIPVWIRMRGSLNVNWNAKTFDNFSTRASSDFLWWRFFFLSIWDFIIAMINWIKKRIAFFVMDEKSSTVWNDSGLKCLYKSFIYYETVEMSSAHGIPDACAEYRNFPKRSFFWCSASIRHNRKRMPIAWLWRGNENNFHMILFLHNDIGNVEFYC